MTLGTLNLHGSHPVERDVPSVFPPFFHSSATSAPARPPSGARPSRGVHHRWTLRCLGRHPVPNARSFRWSRNSPLGRAGNLMAPLVLGAPSQLSGMLPLVNARGPWRTMGDLYELDPVPGWVVLVFGSFGVPLGFVWGSFGHVEPMRSNKRSSNMQ